MPKFVTLLSFLVSLTVSAAAEADEIPTKVTELAARFHKTMVVCPDRIWADYSWNGLRVLFAYPKGETSYLWDASTNSIQAVKNDSLPPHLLTGSYNFFESEGLKALALEMNDSGTFDPFNLGVHEFFHYHGQSDWMHPAGGGRGTDYPLSWQSRFYRRMTFDNLKAYFEFGREEDLRKARYWFEKWEREYPLEAKATTDGYEGTARYLDTLASVVDSLGCSASDADLKKLAVQHVKNAFGYSVSGDYFALDSEGYDIGALAALILRFDGHDLKTWNIRMKRGETPLQVLLERVAPLEEAEPAELREKFEAKVSAVNKNWGKLIDNDISNWSDRDYIRVSFPLKLVHTTYSPKFFARSVELDRRLMPLALELHLNSSNGGSSVRLQPNAVVFLSDPSNPCKDVSLFGITLVRRSALQFDSSTQTVAVETPSLVGRLAGQIKADEAGFEYFCAE